VSAPIHRAPMRARDRDDVPPGAGADAGVEHGFVGIGPGTGAKAERMARAFAALPDGAFLWTRTSDGALHLGRVAGPLQEPGAAARAVGLTHVRPATWLERPFGPDEAPAAVVATFRRGGLNLQRTHDAGAERRTAELWASASANVGA
jgi:hypothetical protein